MAGQRIVQSPIHFIFIFLLYLIIYCFAVPVLSLSGANRSSMKYKVPVKHISYTLINNKYDTCYICSCGFYRQKLNK